MNKTLNNLGYSIVFGVAHSITTIISMAILINQYTSLYLGFSEKTMSYFRPEHILPMILVTICLPVFIVASSKERYLFTENKSKGFAFKILDSIILSVIFGFLTSSGLVYFLYSQFSVHQTPQSFITTLLAFTIVFAGMIISGNMYAMFKK